MKELISEMFLAYQNKYYETYVRLFDNYSKEADVISYDCLYNYIDSLIKIRRFDDAYKVLRWIEKTNKHPKTDYDLFRFYLACCKTNDCERVLNRGNIPHINELYVSSMYLLEGKIEEAKKTIHSLDPERKEKMYWKILVNIYNYENYNSFIETSYDAFIKNGNKLEPGYIVYLKNRPDGLDIIDGDTKADSRPYLIWKCEGDLVHLFPVTTSVKQEGYKLYQQNYRNSECDRSVKPNACYTSIDNILTIKDKLLDKDYHTVLKNIYRGLYFSNNLVFQHNNEYFMQLYNKKAKLHNIIIVVNKDNYEPHRYYVTGENDNYYEVVEINYDKELITGNKELFSKKNYVIDAVELSDEEIDEIEKQITPSEKRDDFIGAKIEYCGDRYIVLYENENYCACIYDPYSPSFIRPICIKKNDIKNIFGYLNSDDLDELRDMTDRNSRIPIKKMLKKQK